VFNQFLLGASGIGSDACELGREQAMSSSNLDVMRLLHCGFGMQVH
jgi:hypothetical protein